MGSIRETTDDVVEEITSPDADGECLHSELAFGGRPTDVSTLRCAGPMGSAATNSFDRRWISGSTIHP